MGLTNLPKPRLQTTIENVETNIKTWIDNFGMSIKKEPGQESYFSYVVTPPNGIPISVRRTKTQDRYIILRTGIGISSEHQRMLAQLSEEQQSRIFDELLLELARINIHWQISPCIFTFASSLSTRERMKEAVDQGVIDRMS
jgi:hypothetical protein